MRLAPCAAYGGSGASSRRTLPQNPRADDIHPYTVQYTSVAVFLRANKVYSYGVPLEMPLQTPACQAL